MHRHSDGGAENDGHENAGHENLRICLMNCPVADILILSIAWLSYG